MLSGGRPAPSPQKSGLNSPEISSFFGADPEVFDVPVAAWWRHERVTVGIEERVEADETAGHFGTGGKRVQVRVWRVEGEGEQYNPLKEAPDLYMNFANIFATWDGAMPDDLNDKLKDFFSDYGLLFAGGDYFTRGDQISGDRPSCSSSIDVIDHGRSLAMATELAERVNNYRHSMAESDAAALRAWLSGHMNPIGLSGPNLLTRSERALSAVITRNLGGAVTLGCYATPEGLRPVYFPVNLLAVMWLQLFDAVCTRSLIRLRCADPKCQRPFVADRTSKIYHLARCEKNHSERKRYARKVANDTA